MKPYQQNNYDFAYNAQVENNTATNQAKFKNNNLAAIEEEMDQVEELENEKRIGGALANP